MLPASSQVPSIPFYQNQSVANIAHGTGRELLPGNTLEGALNAVAVGADIIELDVHLTFDNVVVVRHDASVDATTDGVGLIADLTLAELQAFNVGFHESDYPLKLADAGIRIPTLESLFSALPDERFLIELKPDDTETGVQLCQLVFGLWVAAPSASGFFSLFGIAGFSSDVSTGSYFPWRRGGPNICSFELARSWTSL